MTISAKPICIAGMLSISCVLFGTAAMAAPVPTTLHQVLQARILRDMRMPAVLGGHAIEGGIARVAFTVGSDGRTHDVVIARRSGSAAVDREAVRLIASFHGLPAGVDGRQLSAVLQYPSSGQQEDMASRSAFTSQVTLAMNDAASAIRLASTPPVAQAGLAKVAYAEPVAVIR